MRNVFLTFLILVLGIPAICTSQVKVIHATKEDDKIMDLVLMLPEVRNADNYVRRGTKDKRHLFTYVKSEPSNDNNFYEVVVAEDNGYAYHTHFIFLVNAKTYAVLYQDNVTDKLIPLKQCSKRLFKEYPKKG